MKFLYDAVMAILLIVSSITFVVICWFVVWIIMHIVCEVNHKQQRINIIKVDTCACQLIEDIQETNWKIAVQKSKKC